jgi:hypothetical protein
MIKEEFLHYIWKYRLFDSEYFYFKDNRIEVVETGQHNLSSGPDFFNAKIKIGNTVWAGNVEIHVKASDWYKHNHHEDPAYDNIILHLVHNPDRAVYRRNGEEIPFVRLGFHPGLLKTYNKLLQKSDNPVCYNVFARMDPVFYHEWTGRLGIIRLERRVNDIMAKLAKYQYDWNEILYQHLAAAFGLNQNSDPFRLLSQAVPLKFIYKNRLNPSALNAAFFGQAGFLDETISDDPYYQQLQREYSSLKIYLPDPLPGKHLWKLMRLRPPAFPVVRIPQLISLVKNSFPLMEKLLENKDSRDLMDLFSKNIKNYWTEHFLYGKSGRRAEYMPSADTYRIWILNAVVPIIFSYGKARNIESICNRAIALLEELPPENNEILKKWNKFGIRACNAFESQSLIELKTRFCDTDRCIDCMIGNKILLDAGSK